MVAVVSLTLSLRLVITVTHCVTEPVCPTVVLGRKRRPRDNGVYENFDIRSPTSASVGFAQWIAPGVFHSIIRVVYVDVEGLRHRLTL